MKEIKPNDSYKKTYHYNSNVKKEMYPKGDVRRLKYIIKTDIKASIDDINNGIAMGVVYGELVKSKVRTTHP